jgi:hypothetical protein
VITKAMLRGPSWRRLFPDIYVNAEAYDVQDHRMWCDAVALALRDGEAVDRYSAAFLWGVDLLSRDAKVTVCVPRSARVWPHPRRDVVRTTLARGDRTVLAGIPLTTPLRTAIDLGRRRNRTSALIALDAMCHRKLVRVSELASYPGLKSLKGCRQLRELLALVDPRAESPMETRLRLLLHDAGAPPPISQHEVRDSDGHLIGRVDLAYPHWRIAIEYEGDHHRERAQFRRDIAGRTRSGTQAGWCCASPRMTC